MTSMATCATRWAICMSRNAGLVDQCAELDYMYPSEGIHRRWDCGFRITCCAATPDQAAFVLSIPRRRPGDETQDAENVRVSTNARQGKMGENLYIPRSRLAHRQLKTTEKYHARIRVRKRYTQVDIVYIYTHTHTQRERERERE